MESNITGKRRPATADHLSKRQKTDHGGFSEQADDEYEPPQRARRTGYPTPRGNGQRNPQTSLHDLMIPRNTYEYEPIRENSIRLVYLHPGTPDEPITCDLKAFGRDNAPKYEALSYVWGSGAAVHEVKVDGKAFYTGPNLHSALLTSRQCNSVSILWIDAMCIDQSNIQERNEQVRMMKNIYEHAQSVISWLGHEDSSEHSDEAMEIIPRLLDPDFLRNDNWPITYAHGFYALARLLERPWFSRLWIVQEAILSRNTILLCGTREVHLMDVVDACNIVKSKLDTIRGRLQHAFVRLARATFAELSGFECNKTFRYAKQCVCPFERWKGNCKKIEFRISGV